MATEMMAYINNLKINIKVREPLELYPEMWHHFCHILSRRDYIIYWEGEVYGTGILTSGRGYRLNGTLVVGQEQDSLGGTFAISQVLQGDIAQLSIWDKQLTPAEIKDMANCLATGRGNAFSLDTATINMLGNIVVSSLQIHNFCQKVSQYLVLPERRSVTASLQQCHLLNASMTVPSSTQENERLRNTLAPFMDSCDSTPWKFWLGVTDEMQEGAWIDLNGNRSLKYENFVSPYPYGGSSENCAALLPDGTWADAKCSLKKCSSCELHSYDYLYLRGLCFENEHQTRFRMQGHLEGRPLFHGYYDLLIIWRNDVAQWILVNSDNNTIAYMSPNDVTKYPLGLNNWTTQSLICGAYIGAILKLSLSSCTLYQFMCRTGECIAHEQRCDLRHDCQDGSDEDECDVVYLSEGYRNHLPPPGVGNAPLELALNFTLTRFAAVDITKMSITVEFQVSISWLDSRISFSHLENAINRAVLTMEDIDKIWLPEYRLLNLEGGKVELLEQVVQVNSALNPQLPDVNAVKLDLMYPGADNELTLYQDYLANFACFFEFLTYPL
ncbi:hypothetical protein SK128_015396 [Halocaridina rubra]|uniref:C-type lectin domain-containing protein n=1 Tax=Halocaridina rubra TaxID=373956 RepID=A0AAN8XDS1_HALRR